MAGAEWIADKINSQGVVATVEGEDVVFIQRDDKPSAHIGIIPTQRSISAPIISLDDVRSNRAKKSTIEMMIAIPRGSRWSGAAMRWLQSEDIAFGGVGDLLSAIGRDDRLATHRNKTLTFVDEGLRRHSRVQELDWIDSKKVAIHLKNGVIIKVALEDAYDITKDVARNAANSFGNFDVLLKTNPNGSITSGGAESVDQLGFETLKWGELFAHLAKRGGQARNDDLRARLRRTRSTD